ncbi:hypothetical protein AAMO2058_001517100 [Amorphochlora amoebiformis]
MMGMGVRLGACVLLGVVVCGVRVHTRSEVSQRFTTGTAPGSASGSIHEQHQHPRPTSSQFVAEDWTCTENELKLYENDTHPTYPDSSEEKSLAVLLVGKSFESEYPHFTGFHFEVDYRANQCNLKRRVLDYFKRRGFHDVDFFLVTNDSPMREDMKKAFNCQPTSCVFETSPGPNTKFVEKEGSDARLQYNEQILGTEMIMNSTKEYTQVVMSRFDLEFQIPFDNLTIDWSKVNLISHFWVDDIVDDNFYIVPGHMLPNFLDALKKRKFDSYLPPHDIAWLRPMGELNFLKDERADMPRLTSIDVIRRCKSTDGHIIRIPRFQTNKDVIRKMCAARTERKTKTAVAMCKCEYKPEICQC